MVGKKTPIANEMEFICQGYKFKAKIVRDKFNN